VSDLVRMWAFRLVTSSLCALAIACGDSDVITHTYADAAELRAAAEADGMSVPALVPPGAHDIRVAYDRGGRRRRWGLFNFRPEDADVLRAKLGPQLSFEAVGADAPPRIEWWPVALRGSLDAERVAATGLQGYSARDDHLVVAVNWNQRRAYYWTPR
jgi:hypothetical protein